MRLGVRSQVSNFESKSASFIIFAVIVSLSGAEYRLLAVLVEHPNRVLDRNQLMDLTLGREATPFDRSIDVQISRLRNRLNDDAREPRIIKTIRNEGYILAAQVERVD